MLTPFRHPSLSLQGIHPSVHRIPENFNAIGHAGAWHLNRERVDPQGFTASRRLRLPDGRGWVVPDKGPTAAIPAQPFRRPSTAAGEKAPL
ncbi:MAG: hypothetical protein ACKOEO_24235 [Planctomycetaceae bacterium]